VAVSVVAAASRALLAHRAILHRCDYRVHLAGRNPARKAVVNRHGLTGKGAAWGGENCCSNQMLEHGTLPSVFIAFSIDVS
jgi:hypothetical protein